LLANRKDGRGESESTSGPAKNKRCSDAETLLPTWRKKLNEAADVDPATKKIASRFLIMGEKKKLACRAFKPDLATLDHAGVHIKKNE
jgi:hypothetical protein